MILRRDDAYHLPLPHDARRISLHGPWFLVWYALPHMLLQNARLRWDVKNAGACFHFFGGRSEVDVNVC